MELHGALRGKVPPLALGEVGVGSVGSSGIEVPALCVGSMGSSGNTLLCSASEFDSGALGFGISPAGGCMTRDRLRTARCMPVWVVSVRSSGGWVVALGA